MHRKDGLEITNSGPKNLASDEASQAFALEVEVGRELLQRCFHADAVAGAQLVYFAVLDEPIRPADADDRGAETQFTQRFEDYAAETAHEDVILECNDRSYISVGGEQLAVEWLDESRIDDS